ncbi:unnamed protein product, partial [Prunus brigantina]
VQPKPTSASHEALPSSSSSSSSSKRSIYEVFLSFRGEDTRKKFTGHLHMALQNAGVNVFIDDDELRRGEDITAELVRAIRGSRISVIVFSSNYAESSWCLEELVKIMECRKTLGQKVFPIFYDVNPSDVRKQTGSFVQAFQKHEKRFQKDTEHKVDRWRAALTEASNLSGWDLRNTLDGHEGKFIQEIINEITRQMNNTCLSVAAYQVGIDSRVEDISCYLGIGSNDVRLIGITGMSGIGKTTVVKAIYNQFYDRFEGRSFLENVREKQLIGLQKQLLYDILKPAKVKVGSVAEGINVIERRLGSLKVLVVIDNIDHAEQLDALAIKRGSFGPGSRIIITTSDEHLLNKLKVDKIYRAQPMNEEEALELLSWHAFENSCPNNKEYLKLARDVVGYCGGLPLALQVLGSFLFGRSIGEWQSTLVKLKKIPHDQIQRRLKISYDGLSDDDLRDIFCDVSCFFTGMDMSYVIQILEGCGFSAEIGIKVLIERCLVTVDEKNKLMMHDLLRDMGKEIERAKSPKDPGKRSRLWCPEDVKAVLTNKSGTEEVEGLTLNLLSSEETSFSTEAFTKMTRLRLLKLNYVNLTGGYKYLSESLTWLCWHGFPLEVIPIDFNLRNIVAIDMRYSSLKNVVCEMLEKLKILNLSHSHCLEHSPDFSKLPNLEKLILKDCKRLSKLHKSIGDLKSLALVNLKDCKMLKGLPRSFYKLKSIKTLVINGCSRFENLAEDLGKMVSLTTLVADNTAITKVPSSIVRLRKLEYLSLCHLKFPLQLPPLLVGLNCLRNLSLRDSKLKAIPEDLGSLSSLEHLDLQQNSFHSLPNLSGLSKLNWLSLANCNLTDDAIDPKSLGSSLSSLHYLYLENNHFRSLPSLSSLSRLNHLVLDGCTDLIEITDLPKNLYVLQADHCTALERMPNFAQMPTMFLHLNHSPKLIEFPGLERSLNLGMTLFMQGRNCVTDILLKEGMLKGWTGCGELCFPGNDIPKWFDYVEEGGEVHFEVPQEIGSNLKAFAVCMVYSSYHLDNSELSDGLVSISVVNHTKHTSFVAELGDCFARTSHEDYLWMEHLSNSTFNLEGGNSVHINAEIRDDKFMVKKTGVALVRDKVIKFDTSFVSYNPIPYHRAKKVLSTDFDDSDFGDDDVVDVDDDDEEEEEAEEAEDADEDDDDAEAGQIDGSSDVDPSNIEP